MYGFRYAIIRKTAIIAFGFFVLLAVAFSLLLPPFQGGDESAHFMRAMALAEGRSYIGVGSIGNTELPQSLQNWLTQFPIHYFGSGTYYSYYLPQPPFSIKNTWMWLSDGWTAKPKSIQYGWAAMASYPPFSHLFSTLGVVIAKLFSQNVALWFLSARLAGALGISLLSWQALRVAGQGQAYLCALLFLPAMIGSAGSVTADGMVNALSLWVIAETLRNLRLQGSPVTRIDVLRTLLANAVCFVKFGYFLLPALSLSAFLMTRNPVRICKIYLIAAYLTCVTASFTWLVLAGPFDVNAGGTSSVAKQAAYLLHHPFAFFDILWNSILRNYAVYAGSLVGWRSWGYAKITDVQEIYLAALGLVTWRSAKNIAPLVPRSLRIRLGVIAILIGLVTTAIIFGILYLDWTPIGEKWVVGVQGRYFEPLLFMLIFPMLACVPSRSQEQDDARATRYRGLIRNPWLYTGFCFALTLVILGETVSFYYVADGFAP